MNLGNNAGLNQRLLEAPTPDDRDWWDGEVDYIEICNLTLEDVPQLLAIAKEWCDDELVNSDDESNWLPVIAWRSLGQLRAVKAVEPLIGMLNDLQSVDDEWHQEEFPRLFALIGEPAIEPLSRFLVDDENELFARVCCSASLGQIVKVNASLRQPVVDILQKELGKCAEDQHLFNALVVSELLDLKATEALSTIEKVHELNLVDVCINGDWSKVCKSLGVEVTETPMPKPPYDEWPSIVSPTFVVQATESLFESGELDIELLNESLRTLDRLFQNSPEFEALMAELELTGYEAEYDEWPGMFLELAASYCGTTFLSLELNEAEEVLFEIIPRKVMTPPETAVQIVKEIKHFFRFLDRRFTLAGGQSLPRLISSSSETRLQQSLSDPSNFGIGKSTLAQADRLGFDVSDPVQLDQFMQLQNSSHVPENAAQDQGLLMSASQKKAFNKKRKKQLAKKLAIKKRRKG